VSKFSAQERSELVTSEFAHPGHRTFLLRDTQGRIGAAFSVIQMMVGTYTCSSLLSGEVETVSKQPESVCRKQQRGAGYFSPLDISLNLKVSVLSCLLFRPKEPELSVVGGPSV
ncbi:hypothetical protein JRQ81_012253, partial [Phrynocephalus forsythii]